MNASELYQAGKLADAIDAALSEVKKNPTEISRRYLLSELLCFSGDLARADKQLDTIGQQSVDAAVRVSLFRHLIVAETARQQFFLKGVCLTFCLMCLTRYACIWTLPSRFAREIQMRHRI